jgi:hypothetical protein
MVLHYPKNSQRVHGSEFVRVEPDQYSAGFAPLRNNFGRLNSKIRDHLIDLVS